MKTDSRKPIWYKTMRGEWRKATLVDTGKMIYYVADRIRFYITDPKELLEADYFSLKKPRLSS